MQEILQSCNDFACLTRPYIINIPFQCLLKPSFREVFGAKPEDSILPTTLPQTLTSDWCRP